MFLFLEFLVKGETGYYSFNIHTFLILRWFIGVFIVVFLEGEFDVAEETVLWDDDV
jgi:hypothetical protein